jgi:rhamnulokinase
MTSPAYAAVDLGAASGRVMIGLFDGRKLCLEEVHRFPNSGVLIGDSLHWDVPRLWDEMLKGLNLAGERAGNSLESIGLDTWGVDFGLLADDDTLIGNPYHYRDSLTESIFEKAFSLVPKEKIYAQTGIQFVRYNSLFQLLAMAEANAPQLSIARRFLNMSDLFNFFLTGQKVNEFTISTTTQCYNPKEQKWCSDLLTTFGIPTEIFGEITAPGTVLGALQPKVAQKISLPSVPVVASAGHDTACAVAAVPSLGDDYIYISSGTWSLMGVELDHPIITPESLKAGLSNEGGVENKIRFLKNISGLWAVQECRRQWNRSSKKYSYDDLIQLAAKAPAFTSLIQPNDNRFFAPNDMVAAIQAFCRETGQTMPVDKGAIIRTVLESLALEYRRVAEQIDRITGKYFPTIHIIGGGAKNTLLNQFVADATGRRVFAGPVEATVIGNILVQAIAMGAISSLAEGRKIVRDSFDVKVYKPANQDAWDEAYARYKKLSQ